MKKVLIGIAAGAALTLSANAALADGYGYGSVKDATVAPQVNWNGLYIGAAVGYSIASTELDARYEHWCGECSFFAAANIDGISSKGFQGVVTIGYDRQIHPNVLVGIFADYAFGDLETNASIDSGINDYPLAGARLDADISNSWSVGARLGYIHSANTMWYVAAGYAQADLDWKITAYEGYDSYLIDSRGKELSGWFIGGGVEHQLRDNLFLKLDYRYTNYDTERLYSYLDESECGYCGERAYLDSDTDVHSIRLGVNWKVDLFGGHHAAPAYDSLK